MWKVRVYFARSYVAIRKYNRTLSTWLHTCHIFILLLSRKNWAQVKHLHDSCSPQQEMAQISNFLHSSMFGNRFGTVGLEHYKTNLLLAFQYFLLTFPLFCDLVTTTWVLKEVALFLSLFCLEDDFLAKEPHIPFNDCPLLSILLNLILNIIPPCSS